MSATAQNQLISQALPAYLQALSKKDPTANLLICYGEEEYLHRHVLHMVQKQAVVPRDQFRRGLFVELAPSATALCQSTSLFETRYVTFFQQCQAQPAGLQTLLESLPQLTHIHHPCIFSYVKDKLPAAILKVCQKIGAKVMEGAPLFGSALSEFAAKKAREHGAMLTPPAMSHLLQRTGNSLAALDHALAQLALVETSAPLTPEHITRYLAPTREEHFFHLEQLLLQDQFTQAHLFLQSRLARGDHAVLLNSLLIKHCRTALLCKSTQKKAHALPTSALRLPSFVLQNYNRYVQHKPMHALVRAFLLAQETDMALKSSRLPPDLLLGRILDALSAF